WDDESLEFAFLSSINDFGIGHWWIGQIDSEEVLRVLRSAARNTRWPGCAELPYVIASQAWAEREKLWSLLLEANGLRSRPIRQIRRTVEKLRTMTAEEVLLGSRNNTQRFEFHEKQYVLE